VTFGARRVPHAALLVLLLAGCGIATAQTSPPCPLERSAADYPSLQAAIDACPDKGGIVRIPAGDWTYSAPLLLPRTTLGGLNGVRLVGAGVGQTRLVPVYGISWEPGRGVIEWKAAAGDIRRTWDQSISDLKIVMPTGAAAAGIRYAVAPDGDPTGLEKSSGSIRRVRIETWADWPQIGIEIHGIAHNWVLEDIDVDPGSRTTVAFDSKAVVFDEGPTAGTYGGDSGLDNGGCYSCRIAGLSASTRTGGPCALFEGRCQFCSFNDLTSGNGTMGSPLIRLVRSGAVLITNLSTEGRAERAGIELVQSRGIRVDTFGLGTPDAGIHGEPYGDGIVMLDVEDSTVTNWTVWPGKSEWGIARPGAERVRLDAATRGVAVAMPTGNDGFQSDGGEDPTVVLVDQGQGNDIASRNVLTGVISDRTRVGILASTASESALAAGAAAGSAAAGSAQAVTVAGAAAVQASSASSAAAATTATLDRLREALSQ
jgi:hypothetical protein